MPARSSIQAAYDRWSTTYDTQVNPTRDLDALALRSLIPSLAGKLVVEIGCGTGKNTGWLAPQCAALIGLDFSTGMLRAAQRKVRRDNILFVQADIRDPLPVRAGSADIVLINLVLEHIQALDPVLAGAARIMRPGAALIVSEYHPIRLVAGKGARIEKDDGDPEFVGSILHPVEAFQAAIRAAGLDLIETREWYERQLPAADGEDDDAAPLIVTFMARKSSSAAA